MKNILNSPLWKSVFVIVFIITMFLVFRFIDNQTIKTLIGMSGFTLLLFSQNREKLSNMRKNTIYKILLVLIIGFFTINFIFYKMTNRVLMSGISLGFMTGGVLLLKYILQRKKENKIN